jgi:Plasmid pRiA4b ORF-3-like protein
MSVAEVFLRPSRGLAMPVKKRKTAGHSGPLYQLKITLRGSKPLVWRRVIVPAQCNLETLHDVIQAAMGWSDDHLHAFEIDGQEFAGRNPLGDVIDMEGDDAAEYRLCDVVSGEKAKFNYQYDFGDSWDHLILVEKILPPDAAKPAQAFTCIAGAGACPPEDCGGIWGYHHMLEVLKNPKNKEYKDLKEWAGDIDPDAFDLANVNKRLNWLRKG